MKQEREVHGRGYDSNLSVAPTVYDNHMCRWCNVKRTSGFSHLEYDRKLKKNFKLPGLHISSPFIFLARTVLTKKSHSGCMAKKIKNPASILGPCQFIIH